MESKIVKADIAGRSLQMETGKFALQADGAVTIQYGESIVLCTAMMSEKGKEGADFFPMTIDYQERFYAAGKIKGSRFVKRDGRATDEAVLKARLIDRPIRPMFPKGITNEVQGIATVLSADLQNECGVLALTGMSAAMILAGLPFAGPLAGVRIGMKEGQFIVFPTIEEAEQGDLDLIVAGTMEAITMVEAGANEVTEEKMLEALELAHTVIRQICQMQMDLAAQVSPNLREYTTAKPSVEILDLVAGVISKEELDSVNGKRKGDIKNSVHVLEDKLKQHFAAEIEGKTYAEGSLMEALQKLIDENMRKNILEKDLRIDGRRLDEVRAISCETGVLPRTHGSGLFQRGETQILSLTTLGAPGDAQVIDSMEVDYEKRYIHYYQFPPFSTGDIKPQRGPSRREVGHGALAERALKPMIPSKEDFPYTIMVVSETLACNGSSSMGSVCGSTLSLMDAGVPLKKPVSAVAMGLVCSNEFKETGKGTYKILTDIQSFEDFAGDMDFKVAGTKDGITALQMDIKVKGITPTMMMEAMKKGKIARDQIMDEMLKTISEPRKELSKYAPVIAKIMINPDYIRDVIGKGGETIQKITAECGVEIDIEQTGLVVITAPNKEAAGKAEEWIRQITYEPTVGDEFDGTVVSIMDFGAFVEFVPGKDGLVHISALRPYRVNKVGDVVKLGDKVRVKLIKIDEQGRYNLSMKEFYKDSAPQSAPMTNPAPAPAPRPIEPMGEENMF